MTVTNVLDIINEINYKLSPRTTRAKFISVTYCVESLKHEFNKPEVAARMVHKYGNVMSSVYYQKTIEDIIQMWEEKAEASRQRGKLADSIIDAILTKHQNGEFATWWYDNNMHLDEFAKAVFENVKEYFGKLYKEGYIYVGHEIPLYAYNANAVNQLCMGRCDCLMYNTKTGKYLIIDWKTNETIKIIGYDMMLGPAYNIPQADFYSYMIQLSLYKKALVDTYNLATADNIDIAICNIGKVNGSYALYTPGDNYKYDAHFMNKAIEYAYDQKYPKVNCERDPD